VFLLLMASMRLPFSGILLLSAAILGLCIPASRIVAGWVEKKRYTFSVAGAAFVGLIVAPPAVLAVNALFGGWLGFSIPVLSAMAALAAAYAFGEGTGRLACISFGCCYGRPVAELPVGLQKLFVHRAFVFTGATKKISYASGLEGEAVVPVQAMTAVVYCGAGLIGLVLFLQEAFLAGFLMVLTVTQLWRFGSEFLRADYRGGGKITAYQVMGIVSIPYAVIVGLVFPPETAASPVLAEGLARMWNPLVLLFLQGLWLLSFVYTGSSKTTGSVLSFHVMQDRV
jgi:prolipoprotein diacylglyceryltransferase